MQSQDWISLTNHAVTNLLDCCPTEIRRATGHRNLHSRSGEGTSQSTFTSTILDPSWDSRQRETGESLGQRPSVGNWLDKCKPVTNPQIFMYSSVFCTESCHNQLPLDGYKVMWTKKSPIRTEYFLPNCSLISPVWVNSAVYLKIFDSSLVFISHI